MSPHNPEPNTTSSEDSTSQPEHMTADSAGEKSPLDTGKGNFLPPNSEIPTSSTNPVETTGADSQAEPTLAASSLQDVSTADTAQEGSLPQTSRLQSLIAYIQNAYQAGTSRSQQWLSENRGKISNVRSKCGASLKKTGDSLRKQGSTLRKQAESQYTSSKSTWNSQVWPTVRTYGPWLGLKAWQAAWWTIGSTLQLTGSVLSGAGDWALWMGKVFDEVSDSDAAAQGMSAGEKGSELPIQPGTPTEIALGTTGVPNGMIDASAAASAGDKQ